MVRAMHMRPAAGLTYAKAPPLRAAPAIMRRPASPTAQPATESAFPASSASSARDRGRGRDADAAHLPGSVEQTLRTPGAPLDAATRTTMEARFGRKFGEVRVHTDAQAAKSAEAVNAQAYTVGHQIVFRQG